MGTRIKFRGAYEPYVIGANRPHDFIQWRGSRKPRFKEIAVNKDPNRICVRCSHKIPIAGRFYVTRSGTAIHEIC